MQDNPQTQGPYKRAAALSCRGLTKSYGRNVVVKNVSFDIQPGEVHALVGANGAGKSTVLGMISGRIHATAGQTLAYDRPIRAGNPKWSRDNGIATVYQELTVIAELSPAANVHLGAELHRSGILSDKKMEARFNELCKEFELELPAQGRSGDLSVASQQIIEIMRAINSDARVMLFDEPTAALSHTERQLFLRILRQLAARGVAILLVSHNLGEVLEYSDTVTVMRSGEVVDSRPASTWTRADLIHSMTGEIAPISVRGDPPATGPELLGVTDLSIPGVLEGIHLHVRAGEIVGLAGLVGSGRTSLLRAIAGATHPLSGSMRINGAPVRWPRSIRDAIKRARIALVPEERKIEGLHLGRSIADNVTLTTLTRDSRGPFVSATRQLARATALMADLKLSREIGDYPVSALSGGNQQKVAVAKWLAENPQILLFDEPTRGVDVGAKTHVMSAIRHYARAGHAVIVTSSELEEVVNISDRIYVLSRGQIVDEFDMHAAPVTLSEIVQSSFTRTG